MSEFGGLWKHENNQHALVPPKTECGCPSGVGIKNGHTRYPFYGGTQKNKKKIFFLQYVLVTERGEPALTLPERRPGDVLAPGGLAEGLRGVKGPLVALQLLLQLEDSLLLLAAPLLQGLLLLAMLGGMFVR